MLFPLLWTLEFLRFLSATTTSHISITRKAYRLPKLIFFLVLLCNSQMEAWKRKKKWQILLLSFPQGFEGKKAVRPPIMSKLLLVSQEKKVTRLEVIKVNWRRDSFKTVWTVEFFDDLYSWRWWWWIFSLCKL